MSRVRRWGHFNGKENVSPKSYPKRPLAPSISPDKENALSKPGKHFFSKGLVHLRHLLGQALGRNYNVGQPDIYVALDAFYTVIDGAESVAPFVPIS